MKVKFFSLVFVSIFSLQTQAISLPSFCVFYCNLGNVLDQPQANFDSSSTMNLFVVMIPMILNIVPGLLITDALSDLHKSQCPKHDEPYRHTCQYIERMRSLDVAATIAPPLVAFFLPFGIAKIYEGLSKQSTRPLVFISSMFILAILSSAFAEYVNIDLLTHIQEIKSLSNASGVPGSRGSRALSLDPKQAPKYIQGGAWTMIGLSSIPILVSVGTLLCWLYKLHGKVYQAPMPAAVPPPAHMPVVVLGVVAQALEVPIQVN